MSLHKLMEEFCILLDMGIGDKFLNCVYCDFNKRNVTSHCAVPCLPLFTVMQYVVFFY